MNRIVPVLVIAVLAATSLAVAGCQDTKPANTSTASDWPIPPPPPPPPPAAPSPPHR